MNKELVKQRFSRKLNIYDENARIQKQMAERLIGMIAPSLKFLSFGDKNNTSPQLEILPSPIRRGDFQVLEIGCGTGLYFSKIFSSSFFE